jgi:hypothetical protein
MIASISDRSWSFERKTLIKEVLPTRFWPVIRMLIDGQWVESASGKTFETLNPANGEILARVFEGGEEDIRLAVDAAQKAFRRGRWARISSAQRGRLLWKLADTDHERGGRAGERLSNRVSLFPNTTRCLESKHNRVW